MGKTLRPPCAPGLTSIIKVSDRGVVYNQKFTIVRGDWLPGGDELTPTMKLKRRPIAAKYEREIEAMYAD